MSITHSVFLPKRIFRFKSWSRKNYAAFNSLHMVVNIGSLVISISDRIGQKLKAFRSLIDEQILVGSQKQKPEEDELFPNLINSVFLFEILSIAENEQSFGCRFKLIPVPFALSVLPYPFHFFQFFSSIIPIHFSPDHSNGKILINHISNFCEHGKSSGCTGYAVSAW